MTQEEFELFIKEDDFQVFLFYAPLPIPLNFAVHAWFVINLKGCVERWEFGRFVNSPHPNRIGVLKDFIHPAGGLRKYPWNTNRTSNSKLLDYIEGNEDSLACKMAQFIQKETPFYPLRNQYILTGPNSNTYVQWVINHFPECNFSLPWRAIGKNGNLSKLNAPQ